MKHRSTQPPIIPLGWNPESGHEQWRKEIIAANYTYHKQKHPPKPILGWQAVLNGKVIDENNSIAILRSKYGNSVIFKSIR